MNLDEKKRGTDKENEAGGGRNETRVIHTENANSYNTIIITIRGISL